MGDSKELGVNEDENEAERSPGAGGTSWGFMSGAVAMLYRIYLNVPLCGISSSTGKLTSCACRIVSERYRVLNPANGEFQSRTKSWQSKVDGCP